MSLVLTVVNAWRPSLSHLQEVADFGTNPGALRMLTYVPDDVPSRPALVVVLHGSTQSAAKYDLGTGWSKLADRHGFALLMPEQSRQNNLSGSFNWFQRNDTQRGEGEAHSIVQMVEQMVRDHNVDRRRIFVTGLSAGGAMTSSNARLLSRCFRSWGGHCRPSLWWRYQRSGSAARYVSSSTKVLSRTGQSSEGGLTK